MASPVDRHKSRVADLGCIVCDEALGISGSPAVLHHPRAQVGGAQRESDWVVIPLCPEHHVGKAGFHTLGSEGFYARFKLSEMGMLALVIERLYG